MEVFTSTGFGHREFITMGVEFVGCATWRLTVVPTMILLQCQDMGCCASDRRAASASP